MVVSADGLRLAMSPGMDETLGDRLSAAASGLVSLGRGTARLLRMGEVTQSILETADGYLFVTTIGHGTRRSRSRPTGAATSGWSATR